MIETTTPTSKGVGMQYLSKDARDIVWMYTAGIAWRTCGHEMNCMNPTFGASHKGAHIEVVFAQIQFGLALRQGALRLLQRALGLLDVPRAFPHLCLLLCHLRRCPGRRLRRAICILMKFNTKHNGISCLTGSKKTQAAASTKQLCPEPFCEECKVWALNDEASIAPNNTRLARKTTPHNLGYRHPYKVHAAVRDCGRQI